MAVLKRRTADGSLHWCVRRSVGGRRIFRSFGSGSSAREAAQKFDSDLQREQSIQRYRVHLDTDHTVAEAVDQARDLILRAIRPNSHQTYTYRLQYITDHIGDVRLDLVDTSLITRLHEMLVADEYSAKTQIDYLHLLNRILDHSVTLGWIDRNPCKGYRMPRLPDPNATWREIPRETLRLIIDSIEAEWMRDAVIVLAATGMRRGELCGLLWEDVREDRIIIRPHDGRPLKSVSATRPLPITPPVRDVLDRHQADDYPVPGPDGRLLTHTITNHWIALMDRLGLTYRLHDLRHTYACRLAQAGINPVAAQRLLGHHDLKTTLRYYRLSETDILTQAARIDPI